MWPEVFSIAVLLCLSHTFSPVFGQQDHLSQEDMSMVASILTSDDESPPMSAEVGITVKGTGAVDPATTLDCHRRLYSYTVTKADSQGRKCWDTVNVLSCWGRCDSNEIPDWRFPYKRSHHPVCLYGSRREKTAVLRNCEPNVDEGTNRYTFQEADTCICKACKSSEASCEGLRYRGARSGF